jgi:biotin/methionine sulfoxide reductase
VVNRQMSQDSARSGPRSDRDSILTEAAALNSSHWGVFEPVVRDGQVIDVRPFGCDPDPSPIIGSIPDGVRHKSRVARPFVRIGWLERGPGHANSGRGGDEYVPVSWEKALDLVAGELARVIRDYGNAAVFGGSYGWSSAGRFHHAQSQLKRFLATVGGFVNSADTYSNAAATLLVRRVLGNNQAIDGPLTSWRSVVENAELIVMFGGIPTRNTQITVGGMGEHTSRRWLHEAKAAGIVFCNISPMRDDVSAALGAEWLAPRPGSDTAFILAMTHTLIIENLHDQAFLARHCVGFERYRDYLLGVEDGTAKDADWAAPLCEISADCIRALARRMARSRTYLTMNWSLQRSDHGEQPFWAVIALAAVLGQIGLPGRGFGFGLGSMEGLAGQRQKMPRPTLPIGRNPVGAYIPVARIADMLLRPGESFQYNGHNLKYPHVRLVYWCGGNPFHHHQDLNRLVEAFRRPETIIVHEPWWTATARHADIVLPSTITLERNDIAATSLDRFVIAMKQAVAPFAEARNDFDIFADLARRCGTADAFTEGRSEMEFLRAMYEKARDRAAAFMLFWPSFDDFWAAGYFEVPEAPRPYVLYEDFRRDPVGHRLNTPSGRIEIYSETIAGFAYRDCPGHPTWFEPEEWLGAAKAKTYPLHLLSTQPSTRLHGQLDMGRLSQASKIAGREPIRINRDDAARRGIADGDVVRIFNDRGAILAGAVLTDELRLGVIHISTGAWYDPVERGRIGSLDKHGNPNLLTLDRGTSSLAQGSIAQTALVEVEKYANEPPPVTAFDPPIAPRP